MNSPDFNEKASLWSWTHHSEKENMKLKWDTSVGTGKELWTGKHYYELGIYNFFYKKKWFLNLIYTPSDLRNTSLNTIYDILMTMQYTFCINPLNEKRTVLLRSALMASTSTQWNTLLIWVASSWMMPQSARIFTIACPKQAVPSEDCQGEYSSDIHSASPRRSRHTGPSSFQPSCMVQETWVLYRKKIRLVERLHQRYLRSILGIRWQDYVSNEVHKRASLHSLEFVLLQVQLRWAGHFTRMEDILHA